jgi:hypothetical protein
LSSNGTTHCSVTHILLLFVCLFVCCEKKKSNLNANSSLIDKNLSDLLTEQNNNETLLTGKLKTRICDY